MRRTRIHKIDEIRHGTYIKVLTCDVKNKEWCYIQCSVGVGLFYHLRCPTMLGTAESKIYAFQQKIRDKAY